MYVFQGVFTRQNAASLRLDSSRYTVRDLRPMYPFSGIRISSRHGDAGDNAIHLEDAAREMIAAGLESGLAMSYTTWAGQTEHVAGFEIENSRIVDSSRFDTDPESSDTEVDDLFISKMTGHGLPPDEDGLFFPFERGFWGE